MSSRNPIAKITTTTTAEAIPKLQLQLQKLFPNYEVISDSFYHVKYNEFRYNLRSKYYVI
jgi:hypothetical protein